MIGLVYLVELFVSIAWFLYLLACLLVFCLWFGILCGLAWIFVPICFWVWCLFWFCFVGLCWFLFVDLLSYCCLLLFAVCCLLVASFG